MAMRGSRETLTRDAPTEAITAASRSPMRAPGSITTSPARPSLAVRCTLCHGGASTPAATSAVPETKVTSSERITASAPRGSTAPVMMRTQPPSADRVTGGCPATASVSTTNRRRPAASAEERTAMPSMVARSYGGRSRSERSGDRRMRP